jgi:hypothetical protein
LQLKFDGLKAYIQRVESGHLLFESQEALTLFYEVDTLTSSDRKEISSHLPTYGPLAMLTEGSEASGKN